MSTASFLHSSFLQAISAVMLWSVHVQKVPQASEHLCPAKLQTKSDICCVCQSILQCPLLVKTTEFTEILPITLSYNFTHAYFDSRRACRNSKFVEITLTAILVPDFTLSAKSVQQNEQRFIKHVEWSPIARSHQPRTPKRRLVFFKVFTKTRNWQTPFKNAFDLKI